MTTIKLGMIGSGHVSNRYFEQASGSSHISLNAFGRVSSLSSPAGSSCMSMRLCSVLTVLQKPAPAIS
nr:hypothetical protein [Aneurinibacillus sp. XH2]